MTKSGNAGTESGAVDWSAVDAGVEILHRERQVIHDGDEAALADPALELAAVDVPELPHVHVAVHIGAVALVESLPGRVEDPDLLGDRCAGPPGRIDDLDPFHDGTAAEHLMREIGRPAQE